MVGNERIRDRDAALLLALGRPVVVRARDNDLLALAIHVGLPEPKEFAFAKPREKSGREQLPPDFLERMKLQQAIRLPGLQEHRGPLGNLAALHLRYGVRSVVLTCLLRRAERAVQEATQVVQALGAQDLLLALKQRLDVALGEEVQLNFGEVSGEQVALDRRLVAFVRGGS